MQDFNNSIANALELLQSSTQPSIHIYIWQTHYIDGSSWFAISMPYRSYMISLSAADKAVQTVTSRLKKVDVIPSM